ncbi:MAG: YlxR family protein [Chloroflexi bacterium]|nr:YlxR family protein [Chloroflexota bacterium]
MAKKIVRRKHTPQRTCVGCREVLSKRSLIRIVRGPQGVLVDASGKMAGRGAYLHDRRSCWEKGLKGALAQALKTTLTEEERSQLSAFASRYLSTDEDQEDKNGQ